ncbi:hypothetical protein KGY71_04590 [Candidatus Bipolaricaulota bacterium]|nr:hypothetical protein [Candidatus Bipolaricaulota bacterium]
MNSSILFSSSVSTNGGGAISSTNESRSIQPSVESSRPSL